MEEIAIEMNAEAAAIAAEDAAYAKVVAAKLNRILQDCLHKPTQYYYICFGAGIIRVLDQWGDSEYTSCSLDCHVKTNCGKKCRGYKSLTNRERDENAGMVAIIEKIKKKNMATLKALVGGI